jgi:hypothetical protein
MACIEAHRKSGMALCKQRQLVVYYLVQHAAGIDVREMGLPPAPSCVYQSGHRHTTTARECALVDLAHLDYLLAGNLVR